MRTRAFHAILLGLVAAAFVVAPASSVTSAPAANGKIAFVSDRDGNDEIYVMNADGSGQTDLTSAPSSEVDPAWSPDGHRLAFASDRSGVYRIYVMNADGSDVTAVANERTSGRWPSWSPDGRTLAFSERVGDIAMVDVAGSGLRVVTRVGTWLDDDLDWSRTLNQIAFTWNDTDRASATYGAWIRVVNPDGTNERSLGKGFDPSWSPDASRLAFAGATSATDTDIYAVGAAGGTPTKLTASAGVDTSPAWSPDGAQIAFASDRDTSPGGAMDVYVMDADGKSSVRLTTAAGQDYEPAWRKALTEQTIAFAKLPKRRVGDRDFAVTATASSGLPVSFTARGGCAIVRGRVHLTRRGLCTITASQPGDATYDTAPSVERTFAVAPALCKVPRVAGKTLRAARAALKAGHCRPGKVSRAYSAVGKGLVSGASKRPGRALPPGTKIALVLSLGPKP